MESRTLTQFNFVQTSDLEFLHIVQVKGIGDNDLRQLEQDIIVLNTEGQKELYGKLKKKFEK